MLSPEVAAALVVVLAPWIVTTLAFLVPMLALLIGLVILTAAPTILVLSTTMLIRLSPVLLSARGCNILVWAAFVPFLIMQILLEEHQDGLGVLIGY